MKKNSTARLLLKVVMHLVLTAITGGLWLLGLIIWYIIKD